ncbi:MAG: No hits [uncultured Sulfurovum sp.]|uniref:No hits n=1 Tax=uncultured Sulfurovum sp. TaxID=269237 RepID=A0A6S6TQP9_9BACT|nr:MAG: No hits [uncultured Sulfurovum sp.]
MLKKIIYLSLFFVSILNAAVLKTDKDIYSNNQQIVVSFSEMLAEGHDWIGIYPTGSTNEWANQVQWNWTGDKVEGTVTFRPLPEGSYDVRVFYNNSFNMERSKQIRVDANGAVTTVATSKEVYLTEEPIIATFNNMSGDTHDWMAIYPAGSSSDWGNQIDWKWVEADISGQRTFGSLPVGDYEVRVFFHNSFNIEANASFSVEAGTTEVSLALNKEVYAQNELIYIDYTNMQGNESDWIGIYPAGASFNFENVIDFKQTKGNINGQISLGGVDTFPDTENNPGGLAPGNYEVRAFYNNSLGAEVVKSFTVTQQVVNSTLYESADENISENWVHISGPNAPYLHKGMVNLTPTWIDNFTNTSEYRLVFPTPNSTQKVLELDAGGIRWQPHFYIGVILETTNGSRKMIWDPFFNHEETKPFKVNQFLNFPLYVDTQRVSTKKLHVRLDVEKYLRLLEPNNKVISISAFMASGGDLDEIKLSSH